MNLLAQSVAFMQKVPPSVPLIMFAAVNAEFRANKLQVFVKPVHFKLFLLMCVAVLFL